ncbi:hypothetical protein [Roseofilum casamattae]|uniref:Uncharacterized protein n=1 Tax=Roseofilum casamattae BLCC-M143 TaxID=3022442 RepID=A0ABT7BV93_9CYAN|nr:hypothetical protein [Roseofilum casamattae]MDJ1183116.1 hypothetical protein [Roseofilum casamattae BLCC-M143]
MADNIREWLDRIRQLQEQAVQLQQERDRAYKSAANWQQLYETESQQRRHDSQMAGDRIRELQKKLASLQKPIGQLPGEAGSVALEEEIAGLTSLEEVKQKLLEMTVERDRLAQTITSLTNALQAEQVQHQQTRQNLTSALADAIDRLNRERHVL